MSNRKHERRAAARGICLLCEHEIELTDPDGVKDAFFDHFAVAHQSGEPPYTVTGGDDVGA